MSYKKLRDVNVSYVIMFGNFCKSESCVSHYQSSDLYAAVLMLDVYTFILKYSKMASPFAKESIERQAPG